MKINVVYIAQVKKATGIESETIELDKFCTLKEFIVNYLCNRHKKLEMFILDDNKKIRDIIALFIGNEQIINYNHDLIFLKDGDEITILPPIAGG